MSLRIVTPQELEHVWPQVREWINAAIEYGPGDENEYDVLLKLNSGDYLLFWTPHKYAGVVQVQTYPRQKVAVIVYAGGSCLQDMKGEIEAQKPWCREQGVTQIRIFGRHGWHRVLGCGRVGVVMQVAVS